jgi:hypothetical protein
MAREMRGLLDRDVEIGRQAPDIHTFDVERQTRLRYDVAAEVLVEIGVGAAQLMVQVRHAGQLKPLRRPEITQDRQKGDRIGAA